MADFTQGQTGPDQFSGVTATGGASSGGEGLGQALTTVAGFANIFAYSQRGNAAAAQKAELAEAQGSVLAELTEKTQLIAGSDMTEAQKNIQQGILLKQMTANNPLFASEIVKHSNALGSSFIGDVQSATTPEQDRYDAGLESARAAGFVPRGATQEQMDVAVDSWYNLQRGLTLLEADTKEINNQAARENLSAKRSAAELADIELGKEQREQEVVRASFGVMKELHRGNGIQMQNVATDPELTIDQKIQQIALLRDQALDAIGQFGIKDAGDRDMLVDMVNRQADIFLNAGTNEMGTRAQANQLANLTTGDQLALLGNSTKTRQLAAMTGVLGDRILQMGGTGMQKAQESVLEVMSQTIHVGGKDPFTGLFDIKVEPSRTIVVTEGADPAVAAAQGEATVTLAAAVNAGKATSSEQQMTIANIQTQAQGITQFSASAASPKAIKSYVETMADPEMGRLLSNPEEFDKVAGDVTAAYEHVAQIFKDEVTPMIETVINDAREYGSTMQFRGGQVGFYSRDGGRAHPYKQARANKSAAPVLNQYIRALSHMAGHKDYERTWLEIVGPYVEPATYTAPTMDDGSIDMEDSADIWAEIEGEGPQ